MTEPADPSFVSAPSVPETVIVPLDVVCSLTRNGARVREFVVVDELWALEPEPTNMSYHVAGAPAYQPRRVMKRIDGPATHYATQSTLEPGTTLQARRTAMAVVELSAEATARAIEGSIATLNKLVEAQRAQISTLETSVKELRASETDLKQRFDGAALARDAAKANLAAEQLRAKALLRTFETEMNLVRQHFGADRIDAVLAAADLQAAADKEQT